jgi:hypothetical protein
MAVLMQATRAFRNEGQHIRVQSRLTLTLLREDNKARFSSNSNMRLCGHIFSIYAYFSSAMSPRLCSLLALALCLTVVSVRAECNCNPGDGLAFFFSDFHPQRLRERRYLCDLHHRVVFSWRKC